MHPLVRLVLLVEDDPELRRALADLLRAEGFRVLAAPDPVEAFALLSSGPRPAVILLDLLTPRMTGNDFFARLRRDARLAGIPVIGMTGDADAVRPRTERFLRKPFSVADLRGALASLGLAWPVTPGDDAEAVPA